MKHFKILIFLAFWSFASQISSLAVVIGVDLAGGAAGSLAGTLGEDFGLNNPYLQSQISSLAGGLGTELAGGDYYTGSEIGGTIWNYNDNIIAEFSYGVYADDSDPNVQKAREVAAVLENIEAVGTLAIGGATVASKPSFWKSAWNFIKNPFGLFGKGGKEGVMASAIKFEGKIVNNKSAASLSAESFGKVFSKPLVQNSYNQIKKSNFEVVFSRNSQPSWVPEGTILKGYTDPNSGKVTIFLKNLNNADEISQVLAHESKHAITIFRHGNVTPKGKIAAEYSADLREFIIKNNRRPSILERDSILVETVKRMKDAKVY